MTETFRVARAQALIALGSTIPGYYFTARVLATSPRTHVLTLCNPNRCSRSTRWGGAVSSTWDSSA